MTCFSLGSLAVEEGCCKDTHAALWRDPRNEMQSLQPTAVGMILKTGLPARFSHEAETPYINHAIYFLYFLMF